MNNRQGGRRRGRNNQRPQGNGRGGDQGNRIDSRARGNAAQLLEKYKNMARDAQMSGDRVMTEYYLQFADHYFRVLSDARLRQEEQRARYEDRDEDGEPQDAQDSGDAEDGDEIDSIDSFGRAPRTRRDGNANGNGQYRERGGNDRQRDERPRDERRDERQGRDQDRPREERSRDDRPRDDRPRDDRQRDDRPRDDRPREERQPRGERTLRPRRERNDDDRDEPKGLDLAVLPPAIGIDSARDDAAPVAETGDEAPAPKRRGRPRKADTEGESASA